MTILNIFNYGIREDSQESLGLQGNQTSQSERTYQSWLFIGRTAAEAEAPILGPPDCKDSTLWKRPWCWESLRAGGEVDERGWGGWMASLTWWPWVWVSSRSWWWTGRPGVLQSMGSQRVGHDWVTELNWFGTLIQIHLKTKFKLFV